MKAAFILALVVFVGAVALAFGDPSWARYAIACLILAWGTASLAFQANLRREPPDTDGQAR